MNILDEVLDRRAARDYVKSVRRELARPWYEGSQEPGAEVGRSLGLALAASSLVLGVGLALHAVFGGD